MEFDYVVIGAGAAGSVVAGRLAADPAVSVLLLEWGGRDASPLLRVPKGFYYTLRGERYLARYPTATPPGEAWLRGRVLGGSAAVNGMIWSTGAPADWDALAALGNPGWGWADVAPALAALEAGLGVSTTPGGEPVAEAILASAAGYGWARVPDFNAHDSERISYTPVTIRGGRRVTSYRAFARGRAGRNLTVLTRARAGVLLFDGSRVTGVRARHKGALLEATARREVIACAGAVETPLLLERSGIGHPARLRALGVPLRAGSPHVGERVIEQRGIPLQVRLKDNIGPGRQLAGPGRKLRQAARYLASGTGPLATCGYDLACQFKSSPAHPRPDVHGLFSALAIDPAAGELRLAGHGGILFTGYLIRPGTAGSVHASGADPGDPPVIEARFLESDRDRDGTAPILGIAREVLARGPAAELIDGEDFPGPSVATPQQALRYALESGSGIYHAVGSAAMGPGDDDAVDARLRVRGVSGLRVADASVLPGQVSGNTAAPAMAVGWRAAEMIRAEAGER